MPTNRSGPRPKPVIDRFLGHIEKRPESGCWLWKAARAPNGYGAMSLPGRPGRPVAAHRLAWELFRGPIPEGVWVLHRCEGQYAPGDFTYRRCVNPAHLKLGDVLANHLDLSRSGRRRWRVPDRPSVGEAHHNALLTEPLVTELRMWYRAGVNCAVLGREVNVDPETVRDAVKYRTWKHVQ